MRRTILAAAFAAASLSFAFSPAFAITHDDSPPGVTDLGIDITQAGSTHAQVGNFVASLNPDARRAVVDACQTYLKEASQAQDTTMSFCRLAI